MSDLAYKDKSFILSDPMIASGKSMLLAFDELLHNGKPKHTHFVSIIASTQGIEYMEKIYAPLIVQFGLEPLMKN